MARTRRKKRDAGLYCDVIGVVLLFLSVVMLVSLLTKDSGIIGGALGTLLRIFAGVGAFIVPLAVAAIGIIFLIGPFLPASRNAAFGAILIFFSIVGWKHLSAVRDVDPKNFSVFFSTEMLSTGGGFTGAALAYILKMYLGHLGAFTALIALGVIGIILMTGIPLFELVRSIHIFGKGTLDTAKNRFPKQQSPLKKTSAPQPKPEPTASVIQRIKNKSILLQRGDSKEDSQPKPERPPVAVNVSQPKISSNGGNGKKDESGQKTLSLETDSIGKDFRLPPLDLLADPQPPPKRVEEELRGNIEIIERTLEEFRVPANVVEISHGPTVTRYEVQLAPGIKVNKIVSLADNLAMQLAAIDVRVEAPIPGKSAIGVEVPNKKPGIVGLREVIDTDEFRNSPSKLLFALGRDVAGEPKYADLVKMPHLLVAGSTNSGKSVCLNALITSLLYRATPDELKLILIDPKRVELSLFDGIPHLCHPVVRDVRMAAGIFRAAVKEMDRRYDLLAQVGARNIQSYNSKVSEKEKLPYLVLVVDELADLMMQAAAEIETSICRLAQLARATGIHLVIATQRPSVDVVTGLIKANIGSRIAFAVSSQVDSRTILDMNGAERLIGRGDLLFLPMDASKPIRVQGCYLSEKEIEDVCNYLKNERKPEYTLQITEAGSGLSGEVEGTDDEFYEAAVRLIVSKGFASTSMLQRKFKIGYNRASRLVDTMEQQGIVGPLDGAKPREVLITMEDVEAMFTPKEVHAYRAAMQNSEDEPFEDGDIGYENDESEVEDEEE